MAAHVRMRSTGDRETRGWMKTQTHNPTDNEGAKTKGREKRIKVKTTQARAEASLLCTRALRSQESSRGLQSHKTELGSR